MTGAMSDEQRAGGILSAVSSALVTCTRSSSVAVRPALGRISPELTRWSACWNDALLPAERVMVRLGDQQRVREARAALQAATSDQFVDAIQRIVNRTAVAFASAIDADQGVVWELFDFEPAGPRNDGADPRVAGS